MSERACNSSWVLMNLISSSILIGHAIGSWLTGRPVRGAFWRTGVGGREV